MTANRPDVTATRRPAIEIDNLVKEYDGRRVLDGVTLTVPAGTVFGFLGRNGVGKTTTLRILLGLAPATGGSARVLGHDVLRRTSGRVRARIGFLPDVPGFYPWMTAPEYLAFCGGLFGLRGAVLAERIDSLLDLAGLAGVAQTVGGYSRGMRQRLGIAQALINAPDVLFLDEPTSALDPIGRRDVLAMIDALRGRTTVLFSTHILTDVERVSEAVAVIEGGRVVRQGPIEALRADVGGGTGRWVLQLSPSAEPSAARALLEALSQQSWLAGVEEITVDGRAAYDLRLGDPREAEAVGRAVPRLLADAGLGLTRFEPLERSLEDVFVDLVGPGVGQGDAEGRGRRTS